MADGKPKIGFDDYMLTHTIEEFNALPTVDFDDEEGMARLFPNRAQLERDYIEWKLGVGDIDNIGFRNRTDVGNGERLALRERDEDGNSLIHFSVDGGWRYWNDTHWQKDITSEMVKKAIRTVRLIPKEAESTQDKDERESIFTWSMRSEAAARINAMIDLAKAANGVSVDPRIWDTDNWLLNLANGTIELRTQMLRTHQREDYITRLINFDFDPNATAPIWDAFLAKVVPNDDTRLFLQKAAGYSLTGSIDSQCFFILYGTGKNGKSKFVQAIAGILGEYASLIRPESLMVQKNQNNSGDIADMKGVRFGYSIEPEAASTFNTSFIKQQTGGEELKGKFLYHDLFSFRPTHKLWVGTNKQVNIRESDEGIKRRVKQIPFKVHIPPEERDLELGEKLATEYPGILNWALAGLKIYLAEGLEMPSEVLESTEQYFARFNPIGDFFESWIHCLPKNQSEAWICDENSFYALRSGTYRKYEEYAKEINSKRVISSRRFNELVRDMGYTEVPRSGIYYWKGFKIRELRKTDEDRDAEPSGL